MGATFSLDNWAMNIYLYGLTRHAAGLSNMADTGYPARHGVVARWLSANGGEIALGGVQPSSH